MRQKTEELLKQAQQIMGNEADFLIIAHNEGQCGAVAHGKTDDIAQAIFSCMHQPYNQIGQTLYRIVKLIALNTMQNPSPYATDLINTLNNFLSSDE